MFDHKGRRYVRRVQWVWIPQIATRSCSSSLHLNVANEDTNLPLALYKYVHAHEACSLVLHFACKRGIAVPAVKARFFISMSGLHV